MTLGPRIAGPLRLLSGQVIREWPEVWAASLPDVLTPRKLGHIPGPTFCPFGPLDTDRKKVERVQRVTGGRVGLPGSRKAGFL